MIHLGRIQKTIPRLFHQGLRCLASSAEETCRPRRSILYMPGSNQRALEKSKTLDADCLIFDLEDACAPNKKVEARQLVCNTVKAGGYGFRELIIRCNGLDTQWGEEDIRAACASGVETIAIPKVENYETIEQVSKIIDSCHPKQNMACSIWSLIETPRGILNVDSIASHPRTNCIVMGTSDLSKELCLDEDPSRLNMLYALQKCVVAAKAHHKCILDGVYLNLKDDKGFREQCLQGRSFGFDGKTLIHPKTLAVCNEVFTPSPSEVEFSRKIIDAFNEANQQGKGVVVVDGKLIENLHIAKAKKVLSIYDSIQNRK